MNSAPVPTERRERWWRSRAWKRFRRNPLAVAGALIIVFFAFVALTAPALTADRLGRSCLRDLGVGKSEAVRLLRSPLHGVFWRATLLPPDSCYRIPRKGYSPVPKPPSAKYPLGLSGNGYDIYYGLVWGTRTAFYVGVLVVGVALLIGIVIGGAAGYLGGRLDDVLMRVTDVVFAFPGLVLVMVLVTIFARSLTTIILAIAVVGWPTYARMLRGNILQTKAQDYVDAARAVGAGPLRIFLRHVLPNSIGSLIILASLDIGSVVLAVSTLSFLGLGPVVGFADWGQMVSFARGWIVGPVEEPLKYWYTWVWPGLTIALFVLGWNLLGDAVRDALDPRS
jgi:peptide/nickel transport system permease protein